MAKECVAMLLAGGQGSRLGCLTKDIAKPAVPFGGKYRIIDFALSNCVHSGIDTVGVLTQYQPLELNTYIGSGQPWDLDRSNGGVFVLPPYMKAGERGEWYKGTANAIYQNLSFIEQYNPKYVAILSGDHIYKMHYGDMIKFHKQSGAAVSIAVIEVPWEEASRFGIMTCDEQHKITQFDEKPKEPTSNLASMGVYIFDWDVLRTYLVEDEKNPESDNDFGKNIIPTMLAGGVNMVAYPFGGYWKDVGTVSSLWEANMDLIATPPVFDISEQDWTIFSRNPVKPPHFISRGAKVINSTVTEGCEIYGTVENSIIFHGVHIGKGATVRNSIVMAGVRIEDGANLEKVIVSTDSVIGESAVIGDANIEESPYLSDMCGNGITLIGNNVNIGKDVRIAVGSMVDVDVI